MRFDKLLNSLVFIVGLTMPFAFVIVPGLIRNWSLGTLSMLVYSGAVFFKGYGSFNQIGLQYGKIIHYPSYFFLLLIIVNMLYKGDGADVPVVNLSILSCLLFYYCILYHQLKDCKAVDYSVLGFVIGVLTLPLLFFMGIGVGYEDDFRMTIFEQNTNYVGIEVSLAIGFLLNEYVLTDRFNLGVKKYLLLLLIMPSFSFLIVAASRAAFLAFVLVIVCSILFYPSKSTYSKFIVIALGAIVLYAAYNFFITDDLYIVERLMQTKNEGDLSNRDKLWKSLEPAILEHPILGVGETGYVKVAASTIGMTTTSTGAVVPRSPHNVLIEITLYTGIIGFLISVIFWRNLFKKSYELLKRKVSSTSAIILIPFIFAILSQQVLILSWPYLLYVFIVSKHNQLLK